MNGKHTLPADIERTSMAIITQELAAAGIELPPQHAAVVKRVIHTTADFDYAQSLRFTPDAVARGVAALRQGVPIVTDTNMAKAGVSKPSLAKLGGTVACFMADGDVARAAQENGTTRAEAAMEKAAREYPGAVLAVGNAPTALLRLEALIADGLRPELYEQYGEQVRAQVDAAVARAEGKEGPSVLYLRATGSSCKVKNSENSVLGEMLAALGCVNIADSDASLLEELSMEAILAADPERIFIVMQGSDQEKVRQTLESAVLSNPAWQQLSAVKNGRVYYMDQQLYNLKPNARWGEAYEKLAEILYGEA